MHWFLDAFDWDLFVDEVSVFNEWDCFWVG